MRKIDKFIIHCSATREGQDISIDTIRKWHVEENGWSDVGYHYVVDLEGRIHLGRIIGGGEVPDERIPWLRKHFSGRKDAPSQKEKE